MRSILPNSDWFFQICTNFFHKIWTILPNKDPFFKLLICSSESQSSRQSLVSNMSFPIWALLGSLGCREKSPNYHKYVTFEGIFFMFSWAIFLNVVSTLKSYILQIWNIFFLNLGSILFLTNEQTLNLRLVLISSKYTKNAKITNYFYRNGQKI